VRSHCTTLIFAASLVASSALAESSSSELPDYAPLQDLVSDTSVFLLHDLKIPADSGHESVKLQAGGTRRVDFFVDGNRVNRRSDILAGSTYCAVVSDGDSRGFTEATKQFQVVGIAAAIPAPREGERGVSVKLKSFQNSTIHAVTCYQAAQAVVPLTVRIMRYMVRAQADDVSLSFMAPLGAPAIASVDGSRAPASF
jgi:hypothetical protein